MSLQSVNPATGTLLETFEETPAAELEHRLLEVSPGALRHLAPGPVRAGQGHRAHAGIGDDARRRLV